MRRRIKLQQNIIYATSLFIFCVSQFVCASEDLDHDFLKHKDQPYFELRDMSQKKAIEDAPISCPPVAQAPRILEEKSIHFYQDFCMFMFDSDSGENDLSGSSNSSRVASETDRGDNTSFSDSSELEIIPSEDSKKSKRRTPVENVTMPLTDHYELSAENKWGPRGAPSQDLEDPFPSEKTS